MQGSPPMDDVRRFREETPPRDNIADVVKHHVLPLLPAKSLCRCLAVCKDWRRWLSSPFLAHKQTHFFRDVSGIFVKLEDEFKFVSLDKKLSGVPDPRLGFMRAKVEIKASCKGLLCCRALAGANSYYVCNPVRKQWKLLPDPSYYHGPGSATLITFEPGTLNFRSSYDLVCAIPSNQNSDLIRFEIFSSRSESWRMSDSVCDELAGAELTGSGLYSNGVLCWEAVVRNPGSPEQRFVLTFNVMDEVYGVIALPGASGQRGALTEIRGELCYMLPNKDPCEVRIYGGMDMSLKRTVEIELGRFECAGELFRPLACVDDGDTVIYLVGWTMVAYSISQRKSNLLFYDGRLSNNPRFFLHTNSLVDVLCPPPTDV